MGNLALPTSSLCCQPKQAQWGLCCTQWGSVLTACQPGQSRLCLLSEGGTWDQGLCHAEISLPELAHVPLWTTERKEGHLFTQQRAAWQQAWAPTAEMDPLQPEKWCLEILSEQCKVQASGQCTGRSNGCQFPLYASGIIVILGCHGVCVGWPKKLRQEDSLNSPIWGQPDFQNRTGSVAQW